MEKLKPSDIVISNYLSYMMDVLRYSEQKAIREALRGQTNKVGKSRSAIPNQ